MRNFPTTQQLEQLIRFAEDDRLPLDMESLHALNSLYQAVQAGLAKRMEGLTKRNAMLQERLERNRERKEQILVEEGFPETHPGLDSVDVATGLLYQLQQLQTYKLNKNKVILILYEMYCTWLAEKKERLFSEHPVATEYGPQFWRVYKRTNTIVQVEYKDWKKLCELNSGVAAFCRNAAEKYYDYNNTTLEEKFKKSMPYKNATKDKNDGKWNKEISDNDIYNWKKPNANV